MGLFKLVQGIKKYSRRAIESDNLLRGYIESTNPELINIYNEWASIRRNINCPALTSLLGERFCELEKKLFDLNKRNLAFFAGAAGRISDDLIDNGGVSAEEIHFLGDNRRENKKDIQSLFYLFNEKVIGLLPSDFRERFSNIIILYNNAQRDSTCLKEESNFQRIKDIKDRTGGYPILLLYSLMNPEEGDLSVDFSPSYYPLSQILPKTKGGAIFNLGVFISRRDDVYDRDLDRKQGIKSIATEIDFGWKDVKRDIRYIEAGLKKFYPKESINEIVEDCKIMTRRLTLIMDKIVIGLSV